MRTSLANFKNISILVAAILLLSIAGSVISDRVAAGQSRPEARDFVSAHKSFKAELAEANQLLQARLAQIEKLVQERAVAEREVAEARVHHDELSLRIHVAEMSLKQYLDGVFAQELADAQNETQRANNELQLAQSTLKRFLAKKDFLGEEKLEEGKLAVQKAQMQLEAAESRLKILVTYDKPVRVKSLQMEVEGVRRETFVARGRVESATSALNLIQRRYELEKPTDDDRAAAEHLVRANADFAGLKLTGNGEREIESKLSEVRKSLRKARDFLTKSESAREVKRMEDVSRRIDELMKPAKP